MPQVYQDLFNAYRTWYLAEPLWGPIVTMVAGVLLVQFFRLGVLWLIGNDIVLRNQKHMSKQLEEIQETLKAMHGTMQAIDGKLNSMNIVAHSVIEGDALPVDLSLGDYQELALVNINLEKLIALWK